MTSTMTAADGTRAVADRVREAIDAAAPVRISGSGEWLDAVSPWGSWAPAAPLSIGDRGIVDYVPGDLTLTARAGTTLAEIATATRAESQWLTLDPMGSDRGTLGATVATASAGPLSSGFGTPRDIVLGVEAVTGRGAIVRGGGRVVKNVAGFDLTRLFTGSWGTLAVITEVSVRLRARPECDETIAIAIGESPADLDHFCTTLQQWPFVPIALELLSASLAGAAADASTAIALIRICGNERDIRAQAAAIDRLGLRLPVPDDAWTRFREAEPRDACVLRMSAERCRLPELWAAAQQVAAANPGTTYSATPARGVVRCVLRAKGANLAALRALDATVIVERGAPDGGGLHPRPRAASVATLERRLREAFNPFGVLNPWAAGN